MSNFVETTCPSCGADISVPRKEKSVNCMYCGATVVVQEAIKQGAGGKKIENMLQLAENANESGNYEEAYSYYNKILEIDMENPYAWAGKGVAAVWQSTLADDRSGEMMPAFKSGFQNTTTREEKIELANKIGIEVGTAYVALVNLAKNHWSEFGCRYSSHLDMYLPDPEPAAEFRTRLVGHLYKFREMIDFLDEQINPHNYVEEGEGAEDLEDVNLPAELYSSFLTASTYMYGFVQLEQYETTSTNPFTDTWFDDDVHMMPADDEDEDDVSEEGIPLIPWKGKVYPTDWGLNTFPVFAALKALEKIELTEEQKEELYLEDPRLIGDIDHLQGGSSGGGGCFIATASLMDESHPDLLVLRSFRDNSLSTSYLGKAFIDWYYRNGPTMAEHVKTSELLKTLVKTIVVKPMVLAVKVFKIG